MAAPAPPISNLPWWWEDAPPRTLPQTTVASDCDVAIIGAGYTGLTAALTLAKAGQSVQVFERDRPGEGASSRNGGITSGSLRFGLGAAIDRHGHKRGIGFFREAIAARRFLRQLIDDNAIACDYTLTGLFSGALTKADLAAQRHDVAVLNDTLGTDHRIIEKAELPGFTGSRRYEGGMLNAEVGTIHPAKFVSGLLDAALRSGAVVHGETPVTGLDQTAASGTVTLQTARGPCRARHVIVATNGYTDSADPWLRRRLVPVKSRIVATEPLPPNLLASLIPDRRAMGEVRKLYHYFRPSPDGTRILLGAREPAWARGTAAAIAHVRRGLTQIFPELEDAAITHSWAGNVAFSRANRPLMFTHAGLHYAVGYCGSGTVWAPWLGYKTALHILGDPQAASHFRTDPPAHIPFYRGRPWFLPMVMSGYRLQDLMRGRG